MKKFIIHCLLFFVFAVAFYIPAVILWEEQKWFEETIKTNVQYNLGAYGHTHSRLREADTTAKVDLLFIGSSHAYRGFDARQFEAVGLRTFNLGTSSQTSVQTRWLLKKYLDRFDPSMVIFEVYPITTLELDGTESALDIISNGKIDAYTLGMAMEVNQVTAYNTLIYATWRQFFSADSAYHEPRQKDRDTYIQGGYVEKELMHYQPVDDLSIQWSLNRKQRCAFLDIIQMLEERDVPCYLVYTPVTKERYQAYKKYPEADSIFRSAGNYVDFNELMHLDDSLDFYDAHHMNQKGVKKFNDRLINYYFPVK